MWWFNTLLFVFALMMSSQHPDAWALMGHVKYMLGDTEVAKDCYERTINFVRDASEMHSIYLRLASIYLQEGKVRDATPARCTLSTCRMATCTCCTCYCMLLMHKLYNIV